MTIHWTTQAVLGFGDGALCGAPITKNEAVVHACKYPCHARHVGYAGTLSKDHPQYLSAESGNALYLNLIDPPVPLFQKESFVLFFDFVDRHLHKRPLLIHCNKGESRAPSLCLLVMAKRLGILPDESYAAARAAFEEKFPYKPGGGIAIFLEKNWAGLGR